MVHLTSMLRQVLARLNRMIDGLQPSGTRDAVESSAPALKGRSARSPSSANNDRMNDETNRVVLRAQVAALPYRETSAGQYEVLLVTSRDTGRWVIPKGWPMKHRADHDAAAQEAFEEAGVTGQVTARPIGAYRYWKRRRSRSILCEVAVYPLEVSGELDAWPEKGQRQRSWFSPEEAAGRVDEPDLSELVRTFRRPAAP
jgi:8-oxo-dGTP pyrophosphatase MutT (NUDIX family)